MMATLAGNPSEGGLKAASGTQRCCWLSSMPPIFVWVGWLILDRVIDASVYQAYTDLECIRAGRLDGLPLGGKSFEPQ